MKDKRSLKFPGSRSSRAKVVKNHQFNLQHFYIPTYCSECSGLIWGVGYQGFLCQSCDLTVHKQCVEEMVEVCGGKKRGAGKRASAFIPVLNPRKPGSIANQLTDFLGQGVQPDARSPPHTVQDGGYASTQPVRKEDDPELAHILHIIAGISTEHSVRSIINRYEMASPTGPGPGQGDDTKNSRDRKGSADLSRSESLKGKGEKGDRPARRAKSDVDKDEMFRAINQSGSSSASSLSNRSAESPSTSSEYVNDSVAKTEDDSDFEVEELPSLKQVLGEEVLKKLKPKEKKRQEVINELFHTERAHLRNLKVLDRLFYRQMLSEGGGVIKVLAQALFPNIDEIISLHASMNKQMKERRPPNGPVEDVGDILLSRFDNEDGETFRKACAEYCRNQAYALEELKKQKRKEQRLSLLLYEAEASPLCRKLELKDIVPCQMQRLTKYPMLIENLMKYTSTTSQEYPRLERALERSKHILAYVNQAIRECENYHKLRDMQKRLDCRAIDSSTDPNLTGFKALDLTKHKLVYDGPLVWRLRSHRQIELQVLLLEDILVLLQRVDDKLVLKCQSTNTQTSGTEYKYTHSPVLKLQNLLARNVATDKRAFFVINTSDTGPQIYEFAAPSADARKMWCKHINEKAEEIKKIEKHIGRRPQMLPTDEVTVRNRVYGSSATPPPSEVQAVEAVPKPSQSVPEEEGIIATPATEYPSVLIQPDQISVSGAVTTQATPVLSPFAHQEQKATVPVPMDQLRNMAQDMNSILSNLLTVMNTRGAERQSLRQELKAAQDQLDMLKAIQKQMLFGPGTSPKSRPDSFISMTSSISETGEATDSEQTEDDSGSVLKVAQTQVLAQEELVEAVVETVTSLEAKVQPQLALAAPVPHQQNMEDDSDDGYEMIPRNLPLPDDASVRSDMTVEVAGEEECSSSSAVDETLSQISTFSTSSSETVTVVPSVPMTTDLDEGVEDGPSTPTPSPTSVAMTTVSEGSELGEQRDSDLEGMDVDDASMTPARDSSGEDPSVHSVGLDNNVEEKTDGSFQQVDNQANNNNTSSLNADMTVPIEI
ncbi:rho guanine nucleotide exchange factor 11-like isoform X3 [Pomacea canaliculata]|uniref:rho guanine nucleotide exchange factor 11-like isoform X3 n=1 Tax=Pomacea canaliculata TaxID=400727 RepID=UPI000D738EED|nr:rho guanine nucleotide exchange factor 11-like isoform X3 [Pomacea canaliculata]